MKRGASPPRYNERSCGVSGAGAGAGAGLFSVECVWSDIVTLGRGTNKKEAKRRAAAEMLSKLSGTRSSQGCNNLASGNGDVHLGVSNGFTNEKNCSTRNIESASSPITEENYFSRPKEESYSNYVKEERMSLPKPNRYTTLHMNEIQKGNSATDGDSLSCSSEGRQPSSPQKMDSLHESFQRKLSPNAQPFEPSSPSVSAPLSQRMSASTLQQTRSGPEAVSRPGSGDWLGHLQRLGSRAGFAVTRVEERCGGRCRGGGRRCDPSKVRKHCIASICVNEIKYCCWYRC